MRIAVRTSGSLSGDIIEPDTSSRNTRLRGGTLLVRHLAALQADQRQAMLRVPRALGQFGRDRERRVRRRLRIGEAEVVDHLLDAHRAGRRQRAGVEEAPDVRVRRRVDVDRERRQRIARDATERVLVDVVVGFGVERAPVSSRVWEWHAGEVRPLPTAGATPSTVAAILALLSGLAELTVTASATEATAIRTVVRSLPPARTTTADVAATKPASSNRSWYCPGRRPVKRKLAAGISQCALGFGSSEMNGHARQERHHGHRRQPRKWRRFGVADAARTASRNTTVTEAQCSRTHLCLSVVGTT